MKTLKEEIYNKYNEISKEQTPQVDGNGIKIIEKRPDGYDYIIESYMRDCLDRHFPGWTWEAAAPLQFLGSEWVVAQGHLVIIDEYLLALGISPPVDTRATVALPRSAMAVASSTRSGGWNGTSDTKGSPLSLATSISTAR